MSDHLVEGSRVGRHIRSVLINWSFGNFCNHILKGHHHKMNINPLPDGPRSYMTRLFIGNFLKKPLKVLSNEN